MEGGPQEGTSEGRYGALVRHASDIITLLAADGTVLYQNPAIRRVLGYDPTDRVGVNVFTRPLVHPDDLATKRRFLAEAVSHPGETVAATFRLHHADGSWRTIEARGVNLLDDPAIGGIVATYRDVTEARRREAHQRFLAEAGTLLAESLDYERTLTLVARLSLPLLADWCAIDLADAVGGVRRVAVAHADPAKEGTLREMSRRYPPAADGPSPVREVLHSGRSLLYPAISAAQAAALARDDEHARLARPGDKWHLDEVFISSNGTQHYLWRAVDQDGNVLDILVQSRRDASAARKFFRKLLKGLQYVPRVLITDKLASYGAAKRAVLPSVEHRRHKGLNNRAEDSHQPTRERERRMRRFKSPGHAQRFLAAYGPITSHFRPRRHRLTAQDYREQRDQAFAVWREVTGMAAAA